RWGRAWLERGSAECRFAKPVYDGAIAVVTAAEDPAGLELRVESRGVVCATGRAGLPTAAEVPSPVPDSFADAAERAVRPPADEVSLAVGTRLGMAPFAVTPDIAAQYVADVRETLPLYAAEGLIHPVVVLRTCNWVLSRNVVLGPWMHVGSRVQNLSAARVGEALSVRALVSANYEQKGHWFVDLDALVLADGRPVAQVGHLSIYRPRQIAAA
ncbi:MAG TPA: hypothetical protein VHX39_04870, partial [Acetobacteraceae bacterium]|nr:hypothetical protein [Acetobacteraceae bacterium]